MNADGDDDFRLIGPEPWRVAALAGYDGPPPIPLAALERELEEMFGPDHGWNVEHGVHFGLVNGARRRIPTTIATHAEHGRYEWFPVRPDAA